MSSEPLQYRSWPIPSRHTLVEPLREEYGLTKSISLCCHREEKNLEELSSLGHFLKGSSATLGLVRVRDGCERIQRYGKKENEDGSSEPDAELCLKRITQALATIKTDYKEAEKSLRQFYEKDKDSGA